MNAYPKMIYSDTGETFVLQSEDDPKPEGNWSDQPGDAFYGQRPRTDHYEVQAPNPNEAMANDIADIIIRRLREEPAPDTEQRRGPGRPPGSRNQS